MDKIFKHFIEKYLLDQEKAIVLAVSGGPDSVALLDLAVRFLPKDKLVVAHANHGLRMESRWDESFVEGLCADHGLKFSSRKLELKSTSEAEARELRYQFLDEVREKAGAKYILTAHHLNDQAETVLLSLTRGAGPLAVWGMSEQNGAILRPFLSVPKSEITTYVKKRHLAYHLDRSNYDLKYSRNRLRAKVIPELLRLNPRFLEAVDRNARMGHELQLAWGQTLAQKQAKIATGNALDLKKLQKEPAFIQKELIRAKLVEVMGKKVGLTAENVQKVLELLSLPRGKRTEIGRLTVVRGEKYLTFGVKKPQKQIKPVKLAENQTVQFGRYQVTRKHATGQAVKNNILLPDAFGYNLSIRTWRDGDRIVTKAGTKKLQDVFSDAKVGASDRKVWPVVVSGRRIVWVPGLAACVEALPVSKRKVLKLEVGYERK